MLSVVKELEIIGIYYLLFFSLIASREISNLGTDHNGVSTIKRVTLSDQVKNSRSLEEKCKDTRSENVERNIVRREVDYETRNEAEIAENRTTFTDDETKSFSINKKGKNPKKLWRSEKKVEAKILRKVNRDKSNSLLSDTLQKRNVRSVNTTDYYAQRKAVMHKFYTRQREIAAKYAKERNDIDASRNISTRYWQKNNTTNVRIALDKDNRTLEANNEVNNQETKTLNSHVRKPAVGDITDYSLPTTRNCTNASLSGTLPRKSRNKLTLPNQENVTGENEDIIDQNGVSTSPRPNRQDATDGNLDQRWGSCDGTLVYQHNLLLSLKGPSNLDAIFEVVMEGPICITCVEVLRYNRTRALVSLDSGGRGYEYAKLKLKGYENEGFSYIVKIWGVRKTSDDCSRQL